MANYSVPHEYFREFRIPSGEYGTFQGACEYVPGQGDTFVVSYVKCGTTWTQHIVYLLLNDGVPAKSVKQNLPGYTINSFDDFLCAFMAGRLPYGDILDHFQGWYKARTLPNVLFITYESLTNERLKTVTQIAEFLGLRHLSHQTLQAVVKYSSFQFMKSLAEGDGFMQRYLNASTRLEENLKTSKQPKMMRKGIVGDWRNHFTDSQNLRMEEYIASKTRYSDLMSLWDNKIM